MSAKTRGRNSPYMRGGQPGPMPEMPGGPPPAPVAQAKPMYLIALGNETTEDYLDERRNGGPEDFQLIQLMGPAGQVGSRYFRGKTVWDSFAEAALRSIIGATCKAEGETLSAGEASQVAAMAANFADALLEEKKKRDPQRMLVEAGSNFLDADGKPAHRAFDKPPE